MIVFAGPSLSGADLSPYGEITLLPPCQQGDVYLAAQENPKAIGIIDGYFEGAPSVWHKEILWTMKQGIPVFGAASMGALRAAELDMFGMVGIGKIYEGYRDGRYEDDDEVALLHGPEELDYPSLSLAMVNVRATCEEAVAQNVLTPENSESVVNAAKQMFYKQRTWQSIFQVPEISKVASGELLAWFEANTTDQKMLDALELLDTMSSSKRDMPDPVEFEFETTNFWVRNTKRWRQRGLSRRADAQETGYKLFGNDDL